MTKSRKERFFYLDFVRVIAVILILLTHYNAVFLYTYPQQLQNIVLTYRIANIYIGDLGVSIFFIISGVALMTVYGENINIKRFFKKRFISIYPMFWLTYLVAFIHRYLTTGYYGQGIPLKSMIYTLTGFDGCFAAVEPTFYLVGEWFLGCIIIIYLFFPILRIGVKKYLGITVTAVTLLFLLGVFCYVTAFPKAMLPIIRVAEFTFGMIFAQNIKHVNWKVALSSLICLIGNTVFAPTIDNNIQTLYVGIMSFCILVYLAQKINASWFKKCCENISKYSYAVFLCHHYIILTIMGKFDLYSMTIQESYFMFFACCGIIILISLMLYWCNSGILKFFDIICCKRKED